MRKINKTLNRLGDIKNEHNTTSHYNNYNHSDYDTNIQVVQMISKHLRDIKKLLKAYHKKYNWEGKPIKKPTKRKRNGNRKTKTA